MPTFELYNPVMLLNDFGGPELRVARYPTPEFRFMLYRVYKDKPHPPQFFSSVEDCKTYIRWHRDPLSVADRLDIISEVVDAELQQEYRAANNYSLMKEGDAS